MGSPLQGSATFVEKIDSSVSRHEAASGLLRQKPFGSSVPRRDCPVRRLPDICCTSVTLLPPSDVGAGGGAGGDLRKSPRGTPPLSTPALAENCLGRSFSSNGNAVLPVYPSITSLLPAGTSGEYL